MTKVKIEGAGRFSCHYPTVAVIVTSRAHGKDNAMAVGWHAAVSSSPPLYGIAIVSKRLTYELILESNEFGVNFMPLEMAHLIASVGGVSGHQTDKFEQFGIAKESPLRISTPLLRDAYASYECKLASNQPYGDHQWVVGEVVATHFSQEDFNADKYIDPTKVKPTLYIGGDRYATTQSDSVQYLDRRQYSQRHED